MIDTGWSRRLLAKTEARPDSDTTVGALTNILKMYQGFGQQSLEATTI